MKKLLSLLGVVAISGSGGASVIACGKTQETRNYNKIEKIKQKITTTNLQEISVHNNVDLSSQKDKSSIDKALKAANGNITNQDLNYISYSGYLNLVPKEVSTFAAIIKIGNVSDSISLTATAKPDNDNPNQQKILDIYQKIKIKNINITPKNNPDEQNINTDSANANTRKIINNNLKVDNPTLSDDDLTKIAYNGTLILNASTIINLNINDKDKTNSAGIKTIITVHLFRSNTQEVEKIKQAIDNKTVYLPANKYLKTNRKIDTNSDADITKSFINKIFQTISGLTTQETEYISYVGTLIPNSDKNEVTANIKIGSITDTAKFKVIWANDDTSETALENNLIALTDLINNTQFVLPKETNKSLNQKGTQNAFINTINTSNNFFFNSYLPTNLITYSFLNNEPDLNATNYIDVSLKFGLNVSSSTAKPTRLLKFKLKIANTDQEEGNAIVHQIVNKNIDIKSSDIESNTVDVSTNTSIIIIIKNGLIKNNNTLTTDLIVNMTFVGEISKTEITPQPIEGNILEALVGLTVTITS